MSSIVQTFSPRNCFQVAGVFAFVGCLLLPMAGAGAQTVEFDSDRPAMISTA